MKRTKAIILIILALLLGFAAAMGFYFRESKRLKQTITQIQATNLQYIYQLHEFRAVTGLNDQGQQEELFYVKLEQALPLRLQLSLMARALSRHCFQFLPIEVQGIQEYDGKMVAVINLREFDGFEIGKPWHGASWAHGFFQGSAGGASTSAILTESFLQRENPLHWIDGVVFLYQEQPIRNFEHVAVLERTVFRKER
jgi:hypothetical protein